MNEDISNLTPTKRCKMRYSSRLHSFGFLIFCLNKTKRNKSAKMPKCFSAFLSIWRCVWRCVGSLFFFPHLHSLHRQMRSICIRLLCQQTFLYLHSLLFPHFLLLLVSTSTLPSADLNTFRSRMSWAFSRHKYYLTLLMLLRLVDETLMSLCGAD